MSTEKGPNEQKSVEERAGGLAEAANEQSKRAGRGRASSVGARRFGYIVAIIVNVALLYVFNNLLRWNPPLLNLTERFTDCLWAINLSLLATIVGNILFLGYDAQWFKSLVQIVLNCFGLLSAYTLYRVFPFDFEMMLVEQAVRIALLVAMFGIVVGSVVEFFRLFSRKDSFRQ